MTEFLQKRVDGLRRTGRGERKVHALVGTIDSIHGGCVRTTGRQEEHRGSLHLADDDRRGCCGPNLLLRVEIQPVEIGSPSHCDEPTPPQDVIYPFREMPAVPARHPTASRQLAALGRRQNDRRPVLATDRNHPNAILALRLAISLRNNTLHPEYENLDRVNSSPSSSDPTAKEHHAPSSGQSILTLET
jgi:hypothetical protein